jgi:hypothetical protein
VAGYVILAIATIVNFANTDGELGMNVRADLDLFAFPLASLAGLVAWWFLTRVEASDGIQISLLRKGYLALGIQALLGSVTYLILVVSLNTNTWGNFYFWLYAAGTVIVGIGYLLMVFGLRAPETADDAESLHDEGPITTAASV